MPPDPTTGIEPSCFGLALPYFTLAISLSVAIRQSFGTSSRNELLLLSISFISPIPPPLETELFQHRVQLEISLTPLFFRLSEQNHSLIER